MHEYGNDTASTPDAPQAAPGRLTIKQAEQFLRDTGAGDEALASFRAQPEEMTRLLNEVIASPLDLAVKQAIIADVYASEDAPGSPEGPSV